jgi:hypothetical protein
MLADGTKDADRARLDWDGDAEDDAAQHRWERYLADRYLEECAIVGPVRRDEPLHHDHDNREDEDR